MHARPARTVRTNDGSYVVTASTDAASASTSWGNELTRVRRGGATFVVLDLLGKTVDEHGLALLVEAADAIRAAGGELCVVVTSPRLLRVLDTTGADQRFAVCATVTGGLDVLAAAR